MMAMYSSRITEYGVGVGVMAEASRWVLSAARNHCSLHTISKAISVVMKEELRAAGIGTSGITLHIIKTGADWPVSLVKRVLRRHLAGVAADSRGGYR